jgi:hypothetical protein
MTVCGSCRAAGAIGVIPVGMGLSRILRSITASWERATVYASNCALISQLRA